MLYSSAHSLKSSVMIGFQVAQMHMAPDDFRVEALHRWFT